MSLVIRSSFLAVALAGALGFATDASAQPTKGTFTKGGVLTTATPPTTVGIASVSVDGIKKGSDVASNGALDGVPVLNGFRFRFTNGDHEMRQVGLLTASTSSAAVSFFDKNYDDPFNMAASWLVVRGGGTRGEVIGAGYNRFKIALPTRPAGTRLVLTGFKLGRFDDHNVRLIGVWLDEANNNVRVSFLDDQGQGEAALTNQLGQAGGVGPSSPAYATETEAADKVRSHVGDRGIVPFTAKIQYAFIPNEAVTGEDYLTGSGRAASSGKSFPARGGLQGFELYFDNSDHHLLDMGVMPPLAGGIVRNRPSMPTKPDEFIAFQDKNRDDPIKWAAKFVLLK